MSAYLRRRAPIALAVVIAVAVALPLGAFASHQFADVPDSNQYHADIDALADSGVTTGCGGGNFCPSDFVTREQMAAFLNRLGALGAGKTPVVNAAELGGRPASDFVLLDDVVQRFSGGWVLNLSSASSSVAYNTNYNAVSRSGAGPTQVQLELPTPLQLGGVFYGFKEAEVCWDASANATLTAAEVRDANASGVSDTVASTAPGSMAAAGCTTITDATPGLAAGGNIVLLTIDFSQAAIATLRATTVTWTPLLLQVSGD